MLLLFYRDFNIILPVISVAIAGHEPADSIWLQTIRLTFDFKFLEHTKLEKKEKSTLFSWKKKFPTNDFVLKIKMKSCGENYYKYCLWNQSEIKRIN